MVRSMRSKRPSQQKYGTVAFITTPRLRLAAPELIEEFVYRYLYALVMSFNVLSDSRTVDFVMEIAHRPYSRVDSSRISKSVPFEINSQESLSRWCRTLEEGLSRTLPSMEGAIHIAFELVEERLDAIIHLTEMADKEAKPATAVLSRQANVHNVPVASDIYTAGSFVKSWSTHVKKSGESPFTNREQLKEYPLEGIKPTDRVIGMIAHDRMKLEICHFASVNAQSILRKFDYVLATGTTGSWLRRFIEAAGCTDVSQKIRCCLSGPYGGDVQIAYAVVKNLCRKIIFLQDPFASHPHDPDIRLFEQAHLDTQCQCELATNTESARFLLTS